VVPVPVPDLGFQILKLVAQQVQGNWNWTPLVERPDTQMRDVGGDLATVNQNRPAHHPLDGCLLLLCCG
jgi:hypothetical protein